MDERFSTEWWLWRLYRQVATYVNQPTEHNESRLLAMIDDYRNFQHCSLPLNRPEHSSDRG